MTSASNIGTISILTNIYQKDILPLLRSRESGDAYKKGLPPGRAAVLRLCGSCYLKLETEEARETSLCWKRSRSLARYSSLEAPESVTPSVSLTSTRAREAPLRLTDAVVAGERYRRFDRDTEYRFLPGSTGR